MKDVFLAALCAFLVALALSFWFVHAEHHDRWEYRKKLVETCDSTYDLSKLTICAQRELRHQ